LFSPPYRFFAVAIFPDPDSRYLHAVLFPAPERMRAFAAERRALLKDSCRAVSPGRPICVGCSCDAVLVEGGHRAGGQKGPRRPGILAGAGETASLAEREDERGGGASFGPILSLIDSLAHNRGIGGVGFRRRRLPSVQAPFCREAPGHSYRPPVRPVHVETTCTASEGVKGCESPSLYHVFPRAGSSWPVRRGLRLPPGEPRRAPLPLPR